MADDAPRDPGVAEQLGGDVAREGPDAALADVLGSDCPGGGGGAGGERLDGGREVEERGRDDDVDFGWGGGRAGNQALEELGDGVTRAVLYYYFLFVLVLVLVFEGEVRAVSSAHEREREVAALLSLFEKDEEGASLKKKKKKLTRKKKKRRALAFEAPAALAVPFPALFLSLLLTAFQFPPATVFAGSRLVRERIEKSDRGTVSGGKARGKKIGGKQTSIARVNLERGEERKRNRNRPVPSVGEPFLSRANH